jgi:hypothetical protein
MSFQRAASVLAATLLWIAGAPDGLAQTTAQHRGHAAGGHSQTRHHAPQRGNRFPRASYWAGPVAYAPAYAYHAPAYASSYAQPPARPGLYYVPPISANAPMFSFDGSPAVEPDWGWERVNLRQLAAEVRANREAGAKP